MSGGASILALPEAESEEVSVKSAAIKKSSDMSKKKKEDEAKCTCPNECEVHPKNKEKKPLESSKEFFGVTPPTPLAGSNRGSY